MNGDTLEDKFCGCLLGLACGDALGMPAEGLSPYEVSLRYQKIDGFYGTKERPAGSYTGVTQLAMLECLSLMDSDGKPNSQGSARRLFDAKNRNKARWRVGFDVGIERTVKDERTDHEEDSEFASRCLPLALVISANPSDDEALLKSCKEVAMLSTGSRCAMLSAFALAWVSRELIRNSSAMESLDELCIADKSMVARLADVCVQVEAIIGKKEKIEDKLSLRLQHVRRKIDQDKSLEEFVGVNGNSWRHIEAVPLALFCFLKGPDDFDSVRNAATLGGASTFVAGMTGALAGCYSGLGFIPEPTMDAVEGHGSIMELSRRLSSFVYSRSSKELTSTTHG